jgi:hypothetical protein
LNLPILWSSDQTQYLLVSVKTGCLLGVVSANQVLTFNLALKYAEIWLIFAKKRCFHGVLWIWLAMPGF